MQELGAFLKECRSMRHLSLKKVYTLSGIADSKLSRVERGETKLLTPQELKSLSDLYQTGIVPLFLMAGYLTESDLIDYQHGFSNAALLTNEEHDVIQKEIQLFTAGRETGKYDI